MSTSRKGALEFDAVINNSNFKKQIDQMENDIKRLSNTTKKEAGSIDDAFSKLAGVATTAFAGIGLAGFVSELVSVRAEFQSLEASFTTMLGSKEKSDKLMGQIVKSAMATPFEVKDLATGAKSLLAYGVAMEDVNAMMMKLGDVASGLSIPFTELAQIYGKIKTQGRLFAEDINQLQGRGIPVVQELAKHFKVNETAIRGMVETGKVGFKDIEVVINNLTSAGGLFYKSMEAQSKTLNGQISNMQDAWNNMLNALGKDSEGILSGTITSATDLINSYERVIDAIKVMIAMYGAYKTAVIVTSVAQIAMTSATTGWTLASTLQYKWLLLVEKAQKLLNATMLANPYVFVATVLAGLVTAVALYNREMTDAERLQKSLNDAKEEGNRKYDEEKSKIQLLVGDINNENLSREARNKKLRELIAISPEHFNALTLEKMGTKEATKALQEYLEVAQRKAQYDALDTKRKEVEKQIFDAKEGKNDIGFWTGVGITMSAGFGQGANRIDPEAEKAKARKELNDQIVKDGEAQLKGILEEMKNISEAQSKAEDKVEANAVRTIQWYDEQIKKEKELQNLSANHEEYDNHSAKIQRLEAEKEKITGGKSKNDKDKATYADFLEEKKKQYANYQKWIDAYGQESADKQYADLLSKGAGYVDFLKREKARLETDISTGKGGFDGTKKLDAVNGQLLESTTGKTQLEGFKDSLKIAKENAGTLAEYLSIIEEKKREIDGNHSDFGIQAKGVLEDEKQEALRQQKELVSQFVKSVTDTREKELAINAKYDAIEKEVMDKNVVLTDEERKVALDKVAFARAKEMEEVAKENAHNLESFKELMKGMDDSSIKGLKAHRDKMVAYMEDLVKLGLAGSDEYKQLEKDLTNITLDIDERTIQNYERIAQLCGEIGYAMESWGGSLAGLGSLLSGIASQAGNLANTIRATKSEDTIGAVSGAVSGAIQLTNIVVSSAKQRKQAEEDYRNSLVQSRQEMALMSNDLILTNTSRNGNVFLKDFSERAKDATRAMADAQKNLQKSFADLQHGRAKIGKRNAVDWNAVGQGATSGASIGATIGSVVPVIGTAIGGVVGGIVGGVVGIFGGKKKKDTFGSLLAEYPELVQRSADGTEKLNKELAQTLINNNLVDEGTKGLLATSIQWTEQIEKASEEIKGIVTDLAGGLGDSIRNALVDAFKAGTDSAKVFQGEVEKVMESIISQMMFDALFKSNFDTLQKDMTNSLGSINGDGTVVDDLARFNEVTQPKLKYWDKQIESVQKVMAQAGYTIFEGTKEEKAKAKGLEGAIKSITSDQASLIGGQMNAIRMNQAEGLVVVRQQLLYMSEVAVNTRYLKSIDSKLDKLNSSGVTADPLRAVGVTK